MKKKVPGCGPTDAKIVFIGESPGKQEEANGIPFIGETGSFLRNMLKSAGIDPKECYFDNVFQERPPNNEVDYFFINFSKKILKPEYSLDDLYNRLSKLKPNIIVPVGATALWAITGKTQISRYRGSILSSKWGKVIPIYHPRHVGQQFDTKGRGDLLFITLQDLIKIKQQAQFPEIRIPKRNFDYPITLPRQLNALDQIADSDEIAFDIETSRHGILCIGFATSVDRAWCIPFVNTQGYVHDIKSQIKVLDKIAKILSSTQRKIGQNLLYDVSMLRRLFCIHTENIYLDTMIAWHVVYPEFKKGLDFLASIFTSEPYWKDDGKNWSKVNDFPMLWRYNCLDCCITLEVSYPIRQLLSDNELWDVYKDYHDVAFGPILNASLRGIKLDLSYIQEYLAYATSRYQELISELHQLVGDININSSKQVTQLIYDKLRYPPRYKDGKLSVDEETLLALNSKRPHRALQLIVQLRKLHKLISTYLKIKFDPYTLRFHANWNPAGTRTGRLSSDSTSWGAGANLQNIPRGDTEKRILEG